MVPHFINQHWMGFFNRIVWSICAGNLASNAAINNHASMRFRHQWPVLQTALLRQYKTAQDTILSRVGNYATAWMDSWRVTQQILYDFRNRFLTSGPHNSILACFDTRRYYICNHNVIYTLVRWYLTESHHKCSRMCLWRDVDMQRIIDEPKIVVTDYLRRCNRLLTTG